jgi:hypothetical protein
MTAVALMTAVSNGDLTTPKALIADLDRAELRCVIWALLGSSKYFLQYIEADLGPDEFAAAWQRAAAEIATP